MNPVDLLAIVDDPLVRDGQRRLATAAGAGAARTDTFLGERHRRIRQRPGGGWKKASCSLRMSPP
jgi:hypothetical protein